MASLEEPPERYFTKAEAKSETLQNVTITPQDISKKELTANQQADIEQIKQMLLQNQTEQQMADKLGIHRVTVARKIATWMQTTDFDEWADTWWLKLGIELSQNDETRVEVYKQLTRLKCAKTTKKTEVKAEVTAEVGLHNKIGQIIEISRKEDATK